MAGRLPHQPTQELRDFVREKIAAGATQERVAKAMGISVDTLDKYYRDELRKSAALADIEVEECLAWKARQKDPAYNACAIFWAKTRLGYRETVAVDPEKNRPPSELTDAELRERIAARAKQLRDERPGDGGTAGTPEPVRGAA